VERQILDRQEWMALTDDTSHSTKVLSTNDLLLAILTILVDQRDQMAADRAGQTRTELVLASAGFSYATIAQLLGKNPDAVRMMVTRAKKTTRPVRAGGGRAGTGGGGSDDA
jgi:DNA-directed RNA polymerase specialized sigma24 family protein